MRTQLLGRVLLAATVALAPLTAGATTVYITSGSSWTAPADFNSSDNTIQVIGGGGGGATPSPGATYPGGGGGGAYSRLTNVTLTPSSSVSYSIGAGGAGQTGAGVGAAGGDTWFGSSALVMAKGGQGGTQSSSAFSGGAGGQASAGAGAVKYSGGAGGPNGSTPARQGAGGGAAGPAGNGGAGGMGVDYGSNWYNGGGGGGAGGSSGSGADGANAAAGVLGDLSGAGGAGATGGGAGGKGGRRDGGTPGYAGANGANGTLWNSGAMGPGGGGGGPGSTGASGSSGGAGGLYGGGGGPGTGIGTSPGGNGAQGLLIIDYTPSSGAPAYPSLPAGPLQTNVDSRGVDLASGKLKLGVASVAIGQAGQGGLAYDHGLGWGAGSAPFGAIQHSGTTPGSIYTVTLGGIAETFTLLTGGTQFTQNQGRPSRLEYVPATGMIYYTSADGTSAVFDPAKKGVSPWQANEALLTMIVRPDGEVINYSYKNYTGPNGMVTWRPRSIGNNLGYQIHFDYVSNGTDAASLTLAKVTAFNRAVDYCDPDADACTFSTAWPTLTFSNNGNAVTDAAGRTVDVTTTAASTVVSRPGRSNMTYIYDAAARVAAVSNGEGVWTYAYSMADSDTFQTDVKDPLGKLKTIKTWLPTSSLEYNSALRATFTNDAYGRPTYGLLPSGQGAHYVYGYRGTISQTTRLSNDPSYYSDINLFDYYPSDCPNPKTCNKPTQRVNGRGHSTDYTYNANNGAVATVTMPPDGNNSRAVYSYSYQALYAQYKDATGTVVAAPTSVWRITGSSHCTAPTSCSGTASETRVAYSYSTSGGNNLLATFVTNSNGDSTITSVGQTTYNAIGDVVTTDGPVSGSSDTTVTRYDILRRPIGTVSPAFTNNLGQTRYRASRITYDAAGAVAMAETGVVAGQDDTAWSNFTSLQQARKTYDTLGRTATESVTAGGVTYALTQYQYNTRGEVVCVAQRRNPAVYASLPEACQYSAQGNSGPDRITRYTYDDDGRTLTVKGGAATGGAGDKTFTYWGDGPVQDIKDGKNQYSRYLYDGHNRMRMILYPDPTTGAFTSSNAEGWAFDNNDSKTVFVARDLNTVTYTYDAANQLTASSFPNRTFAYDKSGRATAITDPTQAYSATYNALGWVTAQGGSRGATYQYDSAGRRTRMTWPDSFYVTYDYDAASNLISIKENGSTTLVTYSYDDLGRRTKQMYVNGRSAEYSYDPASRLTGITYPFWPRSFDYTRDDAGRIKTKTASDPTNMFWNGHYSVDRSYGLNALNEVTSSGANTVTHDIFGNMLTDGVSPTASYDITNRRTSDTSGATLSYDALDRLQQVYKSGAGTQFSYDGTNMIAEYDASSGAVLRRYVHGPGTDEPIVWYEGSGTAAASRRTLLPDERGSIAVVSEDNGNTLAINSYDDYGVPRSSNVGRFQYTGQSWIPEIGQYYYKARIYAPTMGRFMQSDPTKYSDGMNMYAYVKGDPINSRDPSGLSTYNSGKSFTDELGQIYYENTVEPVIVTAGPDRDGIRSTLDGYAERPGVVTGGGTQVATVCPAVTFTITGVGPDQAPDPTGITFQPRSEIMDGGVAIKPRNFGIVGTPTGKPTTPGSQRNVLSNITLTVDWDEVSPPNNYTPAVPVGLPTQGPYKPVDTVGPKSVRSSPGNLMDVYNYKNTRNARASTRTGKVTADVPDNKVGVTCPTTGG